MAFGRWPVADAALHGLRDTKDIVRPVRAFFDDLFSNPAYQPYDLTSEQIDRADELRFNRDPFDALIVAAAQVLELPLMTRDGDIRGSGVLKIVW